MAVRQIRRIAPAAGPALHDRIGAQALHARYFRSDSERTEREHPELVIARGDNILSAVEGGAAKLIYAFESDRAFREHFEPMFEELLPKLRRALRADTVRFRLSHSPSRPVVEPVLKKLWFAPARDWLQFDLEREAGRTLRAARVAGVRFREGSVADAEAIARIDHEAFPDTPMPTPAIRAELADQQALVAMRGGEVIGFCTFAQHDPGWGYLHTLAVREAERGRGIGRALTARTCKKLFAGGAQRVSLTTDGDNAAAIRLYVGMGFRPGPAGRDYTRPVDPQEVERVRQERRGVLIKFGGWR